MAQGAPGSHVSKNARELAAEMTSAHLVPSAHPPWELNHVPTMCQMSLQVPGTQSHAKETKALAFSELAF